MQLKLVVLIISDQKFNILLHRMLIKTIFTWFYLELPITVKDVEVKGTNVKAEQEESGLWGLTGAFLNPFAWGWPFQTGRGNSQILYQEVQSAASLSKRAAFFAFKLSALWQEKGKNPVKPVEQQQNRGQ